MTEKIVKSVGRVFEILELFKQKQKSMNITDISKSLKYPHSSTLSILKSMEALGYLANSKFDFFPTHKLFDLTGWLAESVADEENILKFMNDLHLLSGETINLSKLIGDYVKIIYGLLGNHAITINVREGTLMPANSSFTGLSALANLDEKSVSEILSGLSEQNTASSLTTLQVKERVSDIREEVIASGYDIFIDGIGAITIPIQSTIRDEIYIIGLVGPTERLRTNENEYRVAIDQLIEKHNLTLCGRSEEN